MSEINPALQLFDTQPAAIDAAPTGSQQRLEVLTRANSGTPLLQSKAGQADVAGTYHVNFMNGANWDLRADGSGTPLAYTIRPGAQTLYVAGVALLVIFNTAPVFNGNSFGAQYLGGLLNLVTLTPGPLANGLSLTTQAAGVTTQVTNITVNEDLASTSGGLQAGSVGTPYMMRCRYDFVQQLTGGSSDVMTWTVADNLTVNRSITEIRAVASVTAAA